MLKTEKITQLLAEELKEEHSRTVTSIFVFDDAGEILASTHIEPSTSMLINSIISSWIDFKEVLNIGEDENEGAEAGEEESNQLKDGIFELDNGFLILKSVLTGGFIVGIFSQKKLGTEFSYVLRKVNELHHKIELQFEKLYEFYGEESGEED